MTILATEPQAPTWACRNPACDARLKTPRGAGHGYCSPCVQRWYKAGRPDSGPPPRQREPVPRRTGTPARAAIASWYAGAACDGMDTGWFFPTSPGSPADGRALAVCASCPVRTECLDYALANPRQTKYGVWGGLTEEERVAERRRRNAERRAAAHRDEDGAAA
jgi:WhiB family transcriptional regulator, redox-sensing transcriptional regulator